MRAGDSIRILKQTIESVKPGPMPKFTLIHLMKCLEVMHEEGPIGRQKLSQVLSIGVGSTRSLLKHASRTGLMRFTRRGCLLTDKGRNVLMNMKSIIAGPERVNVSDLTVGAADVAMLGTGLAHKVADGLKIRDSAIKSGAQGATTLIFKEGKFEIPSVYYDVGKDYPEQVEQLKLLFRLKDGDVLIVGTGESEAEAEKGARAGIITLITESGV